MIPNPTRPDYYWEEQHYLIEEEEERKRIEKESKASAESTKLWLTALAKFLFTCFIWSGALLTAYFIWKGSLVFTEAAIWKKIALVIGVAYLLNCLVFFLKGVMVAMKASNRKIWILLWVINSCFVCLPPALLVHFTMDSFLGPTPANPAGRTANYALWSIGAAILTACLVYSKFGLGTNRVMKVCVWSYNMGYKAAK